MKKLLKYGVIIGITAAVFLLARNHAILERGNTRAGGEFLVLLLPLLLGGITSMFKGVKP